MIRHVLNYFSASSFIFIVGIFLLPIYTRFLTPYDYGILALYLVFGQIFTNIITLGFDSANFRYYFKDKYNDLNFKITNSTNIIILIILLSTGLLITFLTLDLLEIYVFKKQLPKKIILLSYFFGALFKIYQYFFKLLIAQEKSSLFSIFQVLYFVIGNITSLILIINYSFKYEGKIYGDIVAVIFCIFFMFFFQLKYIGFFFSRQKAIRSAYYALPLMPNKIIGSINSNADKYMISYFKNISDLGTYELAMRLSNLNRIFVDNITRAWTPYFFNNVKKNSKDIINNYYKIIFFLSIFYLSFILFSEEVVYLLTTPNFYSVSYFMPIIIFQIFFSISSSFIFNNQINYSEKTKYSIPVTIIEIISNIFLNLILIPIYGIFGAVISLLVSSILSSLLGIYYGQKVYKLPIKYLLIFGVHLIIFIGVMLQFYLISLDINLFLKVLIKLSILVIYIIFLFCYRFIIIDDFLYVVNVIKNQKKY